MSSVYDNWERLVEATLKRENLRQLALCSSFSSSSRSDYSRSSFSSFEIYSHRADHFPQRLVKQLLEKPITCPHIWEKSISLADQLISAADLAIIFKQECALLKFQAEKLACLLRLEAHAGNNHCARLVISDMKRVLDKALVLLRKCSANDLKRLLTSIARPAFHKMLFQIQCDIAHHLWLLKKHFADDHLTPFTWSKGNVAEIHSLDLLLSGASTGAQEMENPMARAQIKVVALRALRYLAKGNRPICRIIIESGTLLSFAILLKNESQEVRHHSAKALMEITAVAEGDAELKSAFNPDSPACKAVVDQLIIIVSNAESKLLIPCIKTIGNLAQNFRAEGARMISLIVNLLGNGEAEVDSEACATLTKFICHEYYLHWGYSNIIVSIGGVQHLHRDYSKIIISIGGVQHLVQLVYLGEKIVKKRALAVVCYIVLHVPDSEDIAQAFTVLRWAAKKAWLMEDKYMCTLLKVAETKKPGQWKMNICTNCYKRLKGGCLS